MYHSLFNHSPSLLTAFCHERALNFVTYFFSISWKHVVFRPLILLMWTVFFFFFTILIVLYSVELQVLCWISDLQIFSSQLIFCYCCYPFCCLPFLFEVTLVYYIISFMGNIIFYFCIHCIDKGAKAFQFLWERIVFSTMLWEHP